MFDREFIVDGIQGGAGTSANMNMNEVIANRAIEMLCGKKGDYSIVHPNDHVNMGATAIGTAINTSPFYLDNIVPTLARITGHPLTQADDLFDATENLDSFVRVSSCQKACAVNLSKMCNDLRILASGPKAGFGEITLPAMQNGSSIVPGKVNPVIPEVVTQVAFHIIGHDTTITMAAEAGQMELNAFEPVIFYNLFDSITTLTHAIDTLVDNCILGITANRERCKSLLDASVGITTALCPYIGYKKPQSLPKNPFQVMYRSELSF